MELIGRAPGGEFPSNLSTAAQEEATGAGGNLTVRTQRLTVRSGAQLSAGTFGAGRGGNLEVSASLVGWSCSAPAPHPAVSAPAACSLKPTSKPRARLAAT
ncbi:MAG: hypothetical protein KME26_05075 [Oscillatoria princeps RMCB-10]|nr:hypothetical protein [Oscillatoria princeps RMCB-10]